MTNEANQFWSIEKDTTHGTSFALHVGPRGTPFHYVVRGLDHKQADDLHECLFALRETIKKDTQMSIRAALGI